MADIFLAPSAGNERYFAPSRGSNAFGCSPPGRFSTKIMMTQGQRDIWIKLVKAAVHCGFLANVLSELSEAKCKQTQILHHHIETQVHNHDGVSGN